MSREILTDAIIKKNVGSTIIFPNLSLSDVKIFQNYPYILIIQLFTKNFAKLTIYPLSRETVLKVIFTGFNIQNKEIEEIIKKLQNFKIIHTSGLTSIDHKRYYECYLDLSLDDLKYKDLKSALDKIKNIFEDIKIVEICLK